MKTGIVQIGSRALSAVSINKLLLNVGILKLDADIAAGSSGVPRDYEIDPGDLGGDTAPAPIEGVLQPSTLRRLRDRAVLLHPSFKTKLKDWWHGDADEPVERMLAATAIDDTVGADQPEWSGPRVRVNEDLWSEMYIQPGGPSRTRMLFSPLMPNSTQSVLDLAAGLGGTAFTLAQTQNLWMDAYESDEVLAKAARKNAQYYGLSNQVPIERRDLDNPGIPADKYHLIYARDRLYMIEHKEELLKQAAAGLKPGGQLMITDYVVSDKADTGSDSFEKWRASEQSGPHAWTLSQYVRTLEGFGLNVVSWHDLTKEYLEDIYAGWLKAFDRVDANDFDRRLGGHLISEGEIWVGRTSVMESGDIQHYRIIAMRE